MMSVIKITNSEIRTEAYLRKTKYIIPVTTLSIAVLLLWVIFLLMNYFRLGHYWVCIPAGILAQSYLIICLHDGTHKSITQTWIDRLIANISVALLFMPFGELYRKYHLIHHCHTNLELDPISPPILRKLYTQSRFNYILCECIPLLYTLYLVLNYQNRENSNNTVKGISISFTYMAVSIAVSIFWCVLVQPPWEFVLLTLLVFNLVTVLRNWCEHMGTETNKKSNTYWFPLGMGIGNHDLHHRKPNLSWLTLTLVLPFQKRDTNPVKALRGILFNKAFSFYSKK